MAAAIGFLPALVACEGSDDPQGGGGRSGAGGGSGAGSGGQPAADDPVPVEPDLSGLVKTSAEWVLFAEYPGSVVPYQLYLLDVVTNTQHLTNPGGPDLSYTSWSPDGKVFMLSSGDAASDKSLRVIRLSDAGFVP